jgi:hypothetical protein
MRDRILQGSLACVRILQVDDYDIEESISNEVPLIDSANGIESDEEETEAEEN